MKEDTGIVFIVDIKGYSQFFRNVEATEGIPILKKLIDSIIENNQLYFKISEIEGDAVLFYKIGLPPKVEDILNQFAAMRNSFRLITDSYIATFPDIVHLDLKAIAHYGAMKEFNVNNFSKLYGNTLVDAHRLLKNSVPSNAYLLLTKNYLDKLQTYPFDYTTTCGTYQCDLYDVGSLCYTYFPFDNTNAKTVIAQTSKKKLVGINLSENLID